MYNWEFYTGDKLIEFHCKCVDTFFDASKECYIEAFRLRKIMVRNIDVLKLTIQYFSETAKDNAREP